MGRRGDINVDFAVGLALFILAFVAAFSYVSGEFSARQSHEADAASKIKLDNVFQSLPRAEAEKRLILVEGYSENEFINLSGYDADIILDESGERICFDRELEGFAADVSGKRTFSLYSVGHNMAGRASYCSLSSFSDRLSERISSPIYLDVFLGKPGDILQGSYCEDRPVSYLMEEGFGNSYVRVCV